MLVSSFYQSEFMGKQNGISHGVLWATAYVVSLVPREAYRGTKTAVYHRHVKPSF